MTDEEKIKRMKELYPTYTNEECLEAAENLERYALLAWEIWEEELNAKEGKAEHS